MSDRSGSGINPILAVIGAIVIAGGIIGAYLWSTWTGPVEQGQLLSLTTYSIHRELSTGRALGGLVGAKDVYDEEIVVADVKIKSTTKMPLYLNDMWANLTLDDGTEVHSSGASNQSYNKVFIAYPKLAPVKTQPIRRNITIQPGQVIEGQMIFNFPISQKQWEGRKDFKIHVKFVHHRILILDHPGKIEMVGQN